MLEVFESDRGQALLAAVGEVAQAHFLPDLEAGSLGGGAAAVDIALLGPTGCFPLASLTIKSPTWHKPGKFAAFEQDALRQRRRSGRLGLSCSDADLVGDTPQPDETDLRGNVVVALTPGETYMLIVSAGGLDQRRRERVCQFVADKITERLPHVMQERETESYEDACAVAA